MVTCTSCGKVIDKIPSWLEGTKVEFVCTNCPNRKHQNIAFVQLAPPAPAEEDIFGDEDEAAAPDAEKDAVPA